MNYLTPEEIGILSQDILFDDETKEIAKEIVHHNVTDRVLIATD